MTRGELLALGLSDRELINEALRIAGGTNHRVKPAKLSGEDTIEVQLARRGMFEHVTSAWYSDPGIP